MTAPFPTRRQEEWRYADLDALQPVWEQLGDVATLTVAAGESLEEVWLPNANDVQVRRVRLALGEADLELDPTVDWRGVEDEQSSVRAFTERELHAPYLHVVGGRKPDLFKAFACADDQRQRLGELLPYGLQRVEVSVAPFLLLVGGERRRHAAASV